MKKRALPLALLLAAAVLLLALPWVKGGWRFLRGVDLSGAVSKFYYDSGGQFWNTGREIVINDDTAWAVYSHREYWPGNWTGDEDEARGEGELRQTALTKEQMEEFSQLVLRQVRLPLWDEYYEPTPMVTCGDGWRITCILEDGREYQTSGYMVYPDGLSLIGQFFGELFPTE